MKNLTPAEYEQLNKKVSPKSPVLKNCACAFLIGGTICTFGQYLTMLYMSFGMSDKLAPGATSVSLIFLSALLTALGIYDKIARHAGAGTLVPITGFANAVVSPALEFRAEGIILGVGAKMFSIAGPVIVYGLITGVIYGIIICIIGLI